ncbi:MAG: hypothetical protein AVDCRST_MAG25-1230, partial [uncultured Rubrobacteraceae bacterium]
EARPARGAPDLPPRLRGSQPRPYPAPPPLLVAGPL